MRAFTILFFALIFINSACSSESISEPELIRLKPIFILDQIGNELFFKNVSFSTDQNHVYIISKDDASIIITNKDLELVKLIKSQGGGPGSLKSPTFSKVKGDSLYVLDRGNNRLNIFETSKGEFLSSFKMPELTYNKRFEVDNSGNSYFSIYPETGKSIVKIDVNGNVIERFGAEKGAEMPDNNRLIQHIVLNENEELIQIYLNQGIIDLRNQKGGLLNSFHIDSFEPIKRSLDSLEMDIKKSQNQGNSELVPVLIDNTQFSEGKLFLSFTDRIGLDRSKTRHLLIFSISNEKCVLEKILKFETGTIDDNLQPYDFYFDKYTQRIYVQGLITKNIYVFELPS